MNRDRLSRHLVVPFLLALVLYMAGYWLIEGRRNKNSPWNVAFEVDNAGRAQLEISQETLGLGPVEIRFTAAGTNLPHARTNLVFKDARPVPFAVPAGECLFQDTTFIPGTIVLKISGAEIQMLPRVLSIGTNEYGWHKVRVIEVSADGTPRVTAGR